ncbi:MAG TPA: hypothetical protein VFX98_01935 [Longimicrobiaceae bacterium]|nr:hypothetical protein [Longimicrobiaceae bacterium]
MGKSEDLGSMADSVTSSTEDLSKVITAGSEAAGVAMGVASAEKFRMHKDNPTQVPTAEAAAKAAAEAAAKDE